MPTLTSRKSPPGRKPPASAWNAFRRTLRFAAKRWPSQQRRADRGRALFFILCTFSLPPICYPKCAVRMLWWFLILGVSAAAVELARKIFGSLSNRTVMIVGAGKMSELAARHLRRSGCSHVFVTNRTHERAVEMARLFQGTPVEYVRFV